MIIKNAAVFTPDGRFKQQDLVIDGPIIATGPGAKSHPVLDAQGLYAIPGLIDLHLHGAMDADFCDGTPESLATIAQYEAQNGITAFTPASMTLPEAQLSDIFSNARDHKPKSGAMLLGINMEGPFLSKEKKGAQNADYLQVPNRKMFERLMAASGRSIRLMTIAPELPGAMDFIHHTAGQTVLALGHTTADYDTARTAFEVGACHVTHLFNAMPPFGHRETGVVGAAFDQPDATVELISDGIHIDPSMVRAAFKLFGPDRVILISDTMRAAGLADGDYSLGGQPVKVVNGRATLSSGTIAGSTTNLMDCLRQAVSFGIPLETAVQAATLNPARRIGETQLGKLAPGCLANVVLLDRELNIVNVMIKGEVYPHSA
ncbi:N-acetylglucosamine-6-phosphate deacetylase [Eubacterium aggregans]|uniref:N-acetylglucosamine-6-phosphate deacetylase n=1 Tax=Eubacterium aggregans TaxID=81409 RepID=A0A1H3ZCD3_9FIRM|nr:N-acetylglucosamine-6-phosphate deacetylase [Eubacterium aggregans]SEA21433.1 N-acetylglucosamine-6-phosphate deacetylase [Eubacterium aggregans]